MDNKVMFLIDRDQITDIIDNAIKSALPKSNSNLKQSETPTKLLSIQDMCSLFGVTRITIHSWMKKGKIPFKKVSRRVYFILEDIMKVMKTYDLSSVSEFNRKLEGEL